MKEEELQALLEALRKGEGVRQEIGQGGVLHIDRPLPFLCIYRSTGDASDEGTLTLLEGQSSYLLAPPDQDPSELDQLLELLGDEMVRQFGGFLLLELSLRPGEQGGRESKHLFRILAPAEDPPAAVLEEMEDALLSATIHRKIPRITIDYRRQPATPSLCRDRQKSFTCLGLELVPVYRDPQSGEVYVFAFEAFRRRLGIALKRTLYAFVRCCTSHRPAHYHELGQRTPPEEAFRTDRALARISSQFDLLLHVTPVNADAAWEDFKDHRFQREVEFLYRPRTIKPGLLKRRLFSIPLERIEDPTLIRIFLAKRDELDRQITLVADRNTPRFLLGSRQLFGDVDEELAGLAETLLERIEPGGEARSEFLDAEAFAGHARRELKHYRDQDRRFRSRVEVRDDVAGIMVSHGNFLIGRGAKVAAERVGAALAHEIGTHALTWHNGRMQPFRELQEGMANYEPMQEGLAVLAEYLVGGLDAGRLRQLAGRVKAVQLIVEGAGFVDTFRVLHQQYGFAARGAFMITMRTFRGGGYTKDAVYLKGLQNLLRLLAQGHELKSLYLGKLAADWLPLIEELRWRRVLQPPALEPRFLSLPESQPRLQRLQKGMDVLQLLEELQ